MAGCCARQLGLTLALDWARRVLCRQAAGDMRLLNPVAPAENHPNCRRDAQGRPVLPGGQAWQQQLLMLCLSSKARPAALRSL